METTTAVPVAKKNQLFALRFFFAPGDFAECVVCAESEGQALLMGEEELNCVSKVFRDSGSGKSFLLRMAAVRYLCVEPASRGTPTGWRVPA